MFRYIRVAEDETLLSTFKPRSIFDRGTAAQCPHWPIGNSNITRMHSSRIRTACLSTISHSIPGPMYLRKKLGGWVHTPWIYPPSRRDLVSEIPPPERTKDQRYSPILPVDKHLWKHYLPATSFAIGNYDGHGHGVELVRLNSLQHCNITIGLLSSNLLSNDISLFPTSNSKLQFIYSCFWNFPWTTTFLSRLGCRSKGCFTAVHTSSMFRNHFVMLSKVLALVMSYTSMMPMAPL